MSWSRVLRLASAASLLFAAVSHASAQTPTVVRLDARLDQLIPKDASFEKVVEGHDWVEGPVWNKEKQYLLFSDVVRNTVYKWEREKGVSVFLTPSGYTGSAPFTGREPGSNGLLYDRQGRLVLCQHGDRRIVRLDAGGKTTVLAERYQGRRINSPNDALLTRYGDLLFTDPPFGLPKAFDDPAKELNIQGVYRVARDGSISLVTSTLKAPNGIALSPDERTLYLSNADRSRPVWMAFEYSADGRLGPGRVLYDASDRVEGRPGVPDGMKTDRQGNLFAAGPGGIYVIAPDGTLLGMIETGVATSNVGWGEDGSVLFITASSAIYRLPTSTRGNGF